jgi:hypothetical protein
LLYAIEAGYPAILLSHEHLQDLSWAWTKRREIAKQLTDKRASPHRNRS